MSPPPASTFLAFHPLDNNIIAIGTEDSTIHIYNVRVDEVINLSICLSIFMEVKCVQLSISIELLCCQVKTKLKGHQKHITGLAFSVNLKIMVSSGADAQVRDIHYFLLMSLEQLIIVSCYYLFWYLSVSFLFFSLLECKFICRSH